MQLLDVAGGPLYSVIDGSFILIVALVFGLVWVGIKLVLEIIGKTSPSENKEKDDEYNGILRYPDGSCSDAAG